MIQIAQDNDTSPATLDEMFTQEEQKALEERGFLGTPKMPTVEEWVKSGLEMSRVRLEPTTTSAPAVEKAPTAGELLVAYLESIIDKRVEEKVSQIMQSHATIALISDEQREMMKEMVDDAIDVHLSDIDHDEFCSVSTAQSLIADAIGDLDMSHAVRRTIESSSIVEDIVDEKIDDIDWEEKVREGLGDILG